MKIHIISMLIGLSLFSANTKSEGILTQLDESLYAGYAIMKMEMIKNDKVIRSYEMEYYRMGDKMRMEFISPAAEKNRRMLNDNSSLWMYLPRTSKVMKLPFKQAFMGSDASNTDLMRLSFSRDYEIVNTVEKENNMVALELKARNPEVSYDNMIVVFDKQKKVPVSQEMFSLSGKRIKTISYENEKQEDGTYFPVTMLIKEDLQKNTSTKIYYSNIKRKNNKPAEYYTLGALKK